MKESFSDRGVRLRSILINAEYARRSRLAVSRMGMAVNVRARGACSVLDDRQVGRYSRRNQSAAGALERGQCAWRGEDRAAALPGPARLVPNVPGRANAVEANREGWPQVPGVQGAERNREKRYRPSALASADGAGSDSIGRCAATYARVDAARRRRPTTSTRVV